MNVFDLPNSTGDEIILLHEATTQNGENKWNKASIHMSFRGESSIDYIWDQEWQDEIDSKNRMAQAKDPYYIPPKWYWEK